eukprot:TRINITY_DN66919_c5_g1_i3.p1 TRINITY_DN66919_c5_g1~~TRINITY_DN66919_c5_g1_i3.p1  ORF type:complete len:338 (+),score=-13.42 TRINITY_DN66919_c5_g1_i3:74-1087(+)
MSQHNPTTSPRHKSEEEVFLLSLPLHKYSPILQFSICTVGVVVFYLVYAYLQELVFTYEGFHYGFFLTFFQFCGYATLAGIHRVMRGETKRQGSVKAYVILSFVMIAGMGLANQALVYVNYPTQVLFKNCKLLSLMLVGLLYRKRYGLMECISAVLLISGLVALSWANMKTSLKFNPLGTFLLVGALLADGVSGNVQENLLQGVQVPVLETIFYPYLFGAVNLLLVCLFTGQLLPLPEYLFHNPQVFWIMVIFSVFGYVGVQCFLILMKLFGAVTAIIIGCWRKVMTLLLSFLLFPKPFTTMHFVSIVLVFTGVSIDVWQKNMKKRKKKAKDEEHIV